jgi:secondary thiamine-phosphate synthase enzyme
MPVYHELFEIDTEARPTFHDVTDRVKEIITRSGITNGIAVVFSQHTTCSIMIQEESHDTTYNGTKYILQDLLDVFEAIIPQCRREGQYMHPGPQHAAYAVDTLGEKVEWSLNTDAHLRSCLMGRSESIPLLDGKLELGQFGQVYFVDFDGTRARKRIVRVQVVGE